MSDRYPGTTNPALERRFKSFQEQLNRLQQTTARDLARTTQRTNVAASDLTAHIEAPDPHPQYATDADLAAHLADGEAHGPILGMSKGSAGITVPAGYSYLAFKNLEVTGTLTLEGDVVIL